MCIRDRLRTDYLFLLFRPFLCRTTARLILYPFHVFLLFDGILEIATNGSLSLIHIWKQYVAVGLQENWNGKYHLCIMNVADYPKTKKPSPL